MSTELTIRLTMEALHLKGNDIITAMSRNTSECATSASRVEMMCSGAWWMDSSCSGEVRAMSTSALISFSATSQRLGLFRTLRYL